MVECRINNRWSLSLPEHRAKHWDITWEPDRLDSMFKNIHLGDTIVDVGSENGDMSALFAKWTGATGDVVMVEPVAKYWPWARMIFEANQLKPPIATLIGFASDHRDAGDPKDTENYGLEICSPWPPAAWEDDLVEEPGFQSIVENRALPHMPLWEILGGTKIDVLTFDVEGSELLVLAGAKPIIERDRPLVYASIHPQFIQHDYGHSDADVYDFFHKLGYEHKLLAKVHEDHLLFYHPSGRAIK